MRPRNHGRIDVAPSADKANDVVCHMFVDKAKATKLTHDGTDYYFCSDECLKKFKDAPQKYAVHCACAGSKKACACDHCGAKEPCDCVK